MKLSKRSIAAYISMTIIGVGALAIVLGGMLGTLFDSLLLLVGATMLATSAYGINTRKNITMLPVSFKLAVATGLLTLVCAATLMTYIILAFRNFQ
jgi:hypothetical protein